MLKKTFRSALSLLLAFCLLLGTSANGLIVWANNLESLDKDGDGKIIYVSLGDSTTNGYGLTGYEFSEEERAALVAELEKNPGANWGDLMEKTIENPNGLLMETPGAYPALFQKYLAEKAGWDGNEETLNDYVNLIQLATSAMRADDVLTHLTWGTDEYFVIDDYSGNKFNSKYFVHNYSEVAEELPFEWEFVLGEEEKSMGLLFQNSVSEADVISINLGSNNFSIYMWGCLGPMIMGMMGNGNGEADYVPMMEDLLATVENDALRAFTKKVAEDVEGILVEKLAGAVEGETLQTAVENLADYGAYTFLSYCITYTKILDRINELNDHADIILIPPVNFMKGFTVDVNGELVDMSDYITTILEAANTYVSTMAGMKDIEFENEFFWADHGGMVDMLMAEMVELEETNFEGAEVLHSRLISSLIYWVATLSGGAFDLNSAGEVTREAVEAYKNNNIKYFTTNYGSDAAAMVYYIAYVGAYVGMEKALITASQKEAVDVNLFLDIVGGTFSDKVAAVFGEVGDTVGAKAEQGGYDLSVNGDHSTLFGIGSAVADILTESETAQGMLYVMAYFMVADGVVCHPSAKGYQTVYEKMVEAYEGGISADDGSNSYLGADVPVIKEIYNYLRLNGYMSTDQAVAIAEYAYDRYMPEQKLTDEEQTELIDFVYTTLLRNPALDDAQRIDIIGNVYSILNDYYKLNENKNLKAFENIVDYLYGKDMLDDEKAFAIVHYTYWKLHDGLTADEFKEVVFYAYLVLFANKAPVLDPAISGTAGVSAPVLFQSNALDEAVAAENMETLLFIYNELKAANPEIVEENPELGVVENLYNGLTEEDEEGNAVLSDAEVFDIFHTVIVAMADPESIPEDKTLTDVVTEKVTAVAEGMTLEDQLIILEKVTEAVNELEKIEQEKLENGGSSIIPGGVSSLLPSIGGGNGEGSNSGVSFSEINKYLKAANTVIQNLKNHEPSLWTDDAEAQYAAISGQIFSMLLNGEGNIDVMELIPALYGMLFDQEGHTLENKIQIVVVIYDTLVELNYISVSRQDAYDYVIDLGAEIQGILDTNLAPVVKELRTDLYELYLELDTLTNTLNNELYKVVEAQREVLEGLNADRAALVAELENLQRQLDAIRNPGAGTYGVQSTRNSVEDLAAELEAAIAETEAAIAALDGSIAALNAKIEADLQGIEEIEAAIAQIRAEIRETETALDAVVDAIEQLNADLEVVYNASLVLNEALENVYNLTLDKIDGKAVVEAVKAIIETVPAIVENLKAAYEQAQVAAEKAQAAIDLLKNFNIQDNVDAIVGGVEDLAGLTEAQIALIQAAAAEAQAKAEALVKEHQPKIEDALKATYTELKTVVIREITAAQTWVENNETTLILGAGAIALVLLPYMDEYVEYNQETGEITIHDDKAIEDLKAFIQPYTSKIDAEILKLQGKAEEARKWLEEKYPIAKKELSKKLEALRTELENLDIEFENPYEDEYLAAKAAIEAEIKKVEAMIDALEAKAQEVENYLNTVLAAIDEVEVALDAVIAAGHVVDGDLVALFDALTKLHDELVDLHDAVVTLHDATVEELFEIFGYCGIVADNFVKVLNTLPAYVNVLKHAVELVTSAEFWGGMHEQLMQLMGEYADRLKDFLSEAETQELILNLLKQYGPVVAEKLLDVLAYLVEEYGHDVAVAFYNYLYNNPEEVIAFFNEYGDEMLDLTKEYGDEALLVVAFALVVYGEDLATYVIENHEAILANLAYWWNIHDEKVFALLQVYAEALGLCEPVRQEIAALREALANLKAELEALKADLENASEAVKAEIEAKIAMIEAAIAEVEAAIAELEAALKAAYETGLANIEALKAAIENLDEKVLELLDAAKKAAIDEINAAIAEVEAAIAGLDAALANLLGDVYEQLKELLISAANMLLDAVIEAVKEYAPKLADDIYNYLYHNPDEVIAFFNEYGDEIWALVEKYGDEALMAVGAVLYLYGEEIAAYIIENQEQLLMAIANWISVHGENAAELLQVYAEALGLCDLVRGEIAKLEALLAELEAKLGELEAELARLQAELEKATDAMKPMIEAAIADVETLIAEIKAAIDEIKAVLPVLNEKLQDLVDALFGLDEALQNLLEIGFDAGALALQQALNAVADAVEALVGVVSDATAEELRKLIDEAKEFLDKAYFDATHTDYVINYDSYYVGLGDDMSVADGYVELLANELGVDFNNLSVPGLSMTDLLYILDEDFVADEYTLAKFAIIYQETGYTVEQMRAVYTAELAKADLVSVGVGSFGITDLIYSQAQGALATILREQMGDYLNNPVIGDYIREILTGYGLNLEATTYTMDWISYIGEDGVAELNEILADVRADLIAKGIPETFTYDFGAAVNEHIGLNFIQPGELEVTIPVADLITMMAESYMYAYVTHLFNAGEVFNSIHEITPNAELLVIGMFNPMDEVVLNFGETTIALGDYYTYMVDVMNLRYLGYAFVVPQTTFVAVPDTMTTVEENVENYADLAQMLMALALNNANVETDVVPTVGGHEYIKEQILNALNVTYGGLLGDVNEDGVVDIVDAWLVMQYDAWIKDEDDLNLALADVNGDGEVDILDAWLIMQYDAWIIDKFPVEP